MTYQPKDITDIAAADPGSAALAGGGKPEGKDRGAEKDAAKKEEPKKRGAFGLTGLAKPASGSEKRSAEVTASGGSRGVDSERNAVGGANPRLVAVSVSAADLAAFKKEGGLR